MNKAKNVRPAILAQVEAFEETWKRAHDEVKELWQCEELIHIVLNLWEVFTVAAQGWRERVRVGAEDFSTAQNESYRHGLHLLLEAMNHAWKAAAAFAAMGYAVERTEPLQKAHAEATSMQDAWETPRLSATVGLREIPIPTEALPVLKKVLAEPPAPVPTPRVQKKDASFLRDSC